MISKVKISVSDSFNYPAKTVALFVHNEEFSYAPDEIPQIVKQVANECKTVNEVQRLIQHGVLPSLISGSGIKTDLDHFYSSNVPQYAINGAEILLFDPKNK